ncbi:AfsR/SARP family transcriptional regulator [Longispora sp. NPDC051575]|uniref:AfsR/SARP family transcriptional regulator n=1 Tax=Longispora sp. NPDC051575 TaxID=3154943 RepID=UPI0034130FD2
MVVFRVLGSIEVCGPGGLTADVAAAKPRALLAALLLRPNEWVRASGLVDALWERPPRSAAGNLRTYVWQLRALLTEVTGRRRLDGRPGSYRLSVAAGELDVHVFTELTERGATALAGGEPESAVRVLTAALRLWRDDPYEDVAPALVAIASVALHERRWRAWEHLAEAYLLLGQPQTVVTELRPLLLTQPFREGLWTLLIRALTQLGRRADALAAYREVHQLLGHELGLEPGPQLRAAQKLVLHG